MRKFWCFIGTAILLLTLVQSDERLLHTQEFPQGIDALSVRLPSGNIDLAVQPWLGDHWGEWLPLTVDNEQDPLLRESNLIMFPTTVASVRFRGATKGYSVHPISVSREPIHYAVAAKAFTRGTPRILSREAWGADETLLFAGPANGGSETAITADLDVQRVDASSSHRVELCNSWQEDYPQDFRTQGSAVMQEDGNQLRWPRKYSPNIKLFVVHHTAITVAGDKRPPEERVRALYSYHTVNRGWGDIGYNFLVDEDGQVYEGRSGGKGVVSGHAYCANVGTIGIALLGNFNQEKPSQQQLQGLKWLLANLSDTYNVDLNDKAQFHGMTLPAVIGHRDVLPTDCPGHYVYGALSQILSQAAKGDISSNVRLPAAPKKQKSSPARKSGGSKSSIRSQYFSVAPANDVGLFPLGSQKLTVRPGGSVTVALRFASQKSVQSREPIAAVRRSDRTIGIWQRFGTDELRVRDDLLSSSRMSAGGTEGVFLRIQAPLADGTYTVSIGDITYTLDVSGRRQRSLASPFSAAVSRAVSSLSRTRISPVSVSSFSSVAPVRLQPRSVRASTNSAAGPTIRIRLGYEGDSATLSAHGHTVFVKNESGECSAYNGEHRTQQGAPRIIALDGGTITVESWDRPLKNFRGTIECRVIDGALVLINELPLDQYLLGLAEEPDSEPFEKQRAFAVAARTYAAYYIDSAHRKFPGKPYDGDDSPARFQKYVGADYESQNPRWLLAVLGTAGQVLRVDGVTIKPPYFSQSDGRTRSPEEAGWGKNFPFAEILVSKPDPWCTGMEQRGHGVGMSGCGAEAQALEGKSAEEILQYYYPRTSLSTL